jgi:hypothetical protein
MPGLVRGVARTAAIAGTATVVSNRVSRRQASRWAQQQQPGPSEVEEQTEYQQVTATSGGNDTIEQLKQLGELKTSGVLTNEEFEAQKAKILAQ